MKKRHTHLIFIAPGMIFYTVFVIFPVVCVLFLSFFKWSGLGPMTFVGFDNYRTLLFSGESVTFDFWHAFGNNLKYLLCVWLIVTPFQYLLAYLFFIKIPFFRYLKFMIFMPYVVSSTIVSFFAILVFNPSIGILNNFLTAIGRTDLTGAWFGDPGMAFKLLVFVIMWQGAGSGMMIFYTNLLDIPQEVMEACRIDGCSEWQRFAYILLPLSLPSCASIITMSTIWALALFDLPFILGGSTGGVNGSIDFVNLVFYRYTFGNVLNGTSEIGFGAAISAVMFVVMLIVASVQNRFLSKFDYNNE